MAVSRKVPPSSGPLPMHALSQKTSYAGPAKCGYPRRRSPIHAPRVAAPASRSGPPGAARAGSPSGEWPLLERLRFTRFRTSAARSTSPQDRTEPCGSPPAATLFGRITTSVTPTISRFTPTSGPAGTTVTITGLNLAGQPRSASAAPPLPSCPTLPPWSSPRCSPERSPAPSW